MKRAGIKVWVLTGDKVGTAKMIGMATGLLDPSMTRHEIREADNPNQLRTELEGIKTKCQATHEKNKGKQAHEIETQGIIVAGSSLTVIDADEGLRATFLAASDVVDVVLACRVSPK